MKMRILPIILTAIFLLSGCQSNLKPEHEAMKSEIENAFVEKKDMMRESYLKVLPQRSSVEVINFNANSMTLGNLLKYSLPKDIRVNKMDDMVNLRSKVAIKSKNLALDEYFRRVFDQTDYEYNFNKETRTLNVYFMQQKTWDLSSFTTTSATSGSMGGEGLSAKSSKTIDKWGAIMNAAKTILDLSTIVSVESPVVEGVVEGVIAEKTEKEKPVVNIREKVIKEWMVEDRNLATLTVYSSAKKVKRFDEYMLKQIELASTQIKLEVKAFEVTLTDDTSSGINWDLFDARKNLGTNYATGSMKSNNGVATVLDALGEGQMGLNIAGQLKGVGVKAIISFLEKHGEVHLVTEPTITVLNGGSAFLSSGDKITYNSGFETLTVEGIAQPIVYPKTEQTDIGTKIVLTPNVTSDGNVMIDVLATLTSLKSMNTTTLAIGTIDKPELGVQEISTQVIAKNNESIRLGGLIIQRLATTKSTAPMSNKLLSSPFDSGAHKIEKRELVIIITPKIIYKNK
jgi:type II secretory pathway component GspD/PulD (secretin)